MNASKLYLARRQRGLYTVITAVGVIDHTTVVQLRSTLLPVLSRYGPHAVLDLGAVDDIDQVGLEALRRTGDRARRLGGDLRLAGPNPHVAQHLRETGVDRQVRVYLTLTAALHDDGNGEQRHPVTPYDATGASD